MRYLDSRHIFFQLDDRMRAVAYSPRVWRDQPLHLCPPEPYDAAAGGTKRTLNWLFLVSALNFSFWSPLEREAGAFAVEWRVGWGQPTQHSWTGYHALLAAINRCTCLTVLSHCLPMHLSVVITSDRGGLSNPRSRLLLLALPMSRFSCTPSVSRHALERRANADA
jgi:hypothetical protein